MNIFREKIMKETRKQPPLGSYDLENINTIKSKINYNVNSGKNFPPFGTSSKRILIEGQMKKDENIGNKGHHHSQFIREEGNIGDQRSQQTDSDSD